jgi:hypothetical protein
MKLPKDLQGRPDRVFQDLSGIADRLNQSDISVFVRLNSDFCRTDRA